MRAKLIELRKRARLTETSMAKRIEETDPAGERHYPRHAYAVFEKGGENPIRQDFSEEEVKTIVRSILNCDDGDLFDDLP